MTQPKRKQPSIAPNYRELPVHPRWSDENWWSWFRSFYADKLEGGR